MVYDTAVIGAGICGCSAAYCLTRAGHKVALIDKEGIAAGGSGAAGAFVSPKISKGGPLKELMEDAYRFSLDFYGEAFPELIRIAPLLHIAKRPDENEKVMAFRTETTLALGKQILDNINLLAREAEAYESVVLAQSGLVKAKEACTELAKDADILFETVGRVEHKEGLWHLNGIRTKRVVLATGAYAPLIDMPFLKLRAVWGHRIDIKTATRLPFHLHQFVSVSATDENGLGAIGATHDVHYHPETAADPYDYEAGRAELLEKAARSVRLESVEVLKDYTGLRSGSNDYYPIVGPVPDLAATRQSFPELFKGAKTQTGRVANCPNLYMFNGLGGYGFVLAPLLAQKLAGLITEGLPLEKALLPERFLVRWARRSELQP